MAKHKIKNIKWGYNCLSCHVPTGDTTFTLSGVLNHLGKPSGNDSKIPLDGIKKEKFWMDKNKGLVRKLTNLKVGKEVDIDV